MLLFLAHLAQSAKVSFCDTGLSDVRASVGAYKSVLVWLQVH